MSLDYNYQTFVIKEMNLENRSQDSIVILILEYTCNADPVT